MTLPDYAALSTIELYSDTVLEIGFDADTHSLRLDYHPQRSKGRAAQRVYIPLWAVEEVAEALKSAKDRSQAIAQKIKAARRCIDSLAESIRRIEEGLRAEIEREAP